MSSWLTRLLVLMAGLLLALTTAESFAPEVAKARKGYGGYGGRGYQYCNYACQKRKYAKVCHVSCGRASRTCVFCAKQDLKELKVGCAQTRSAAVALTARRPPAGRARPPAPAWTSRLACARGCSRSCGASCRCSVRIGEGRCGLPGARRRRCRRRGGDRCGPVAAGCGCVPRATG